MRFNFLNFIALPITFGIGVDYATNVYGRFRLEAPSRDNLIRAVSHSGGAVAVCSGTTIIGYSSLLFSKNGALFSFGALAVLGELACLAAALFLLPAVLSMRLAPEPPAREANPEPL
jgi:predicted RND superfamily exporter protein